MSIVVHIIAKFDKEILQEMKQLTLTGWMMCF
jgi:hypothetical protein